MEEKTFGERLVKLRKEYMLTQSMLAEILFVSPKTVSKWEKDRGVPSVDLLISLSKFFKVSTDYLLTGKEFDDPTKISFVEVNYGNIKGRHFKMPSINAFPEDIRGHILHHFLCEYAKENFMDEGVFIDKVYDIVRPKDIASGVERLLQLEEISTSKIQKTLCVGFARGGRIKDKLRLDGFIEKNNDGKWLWKEENMDKEKIIEAIKDL